MALTQPPSVAGHGRRERWSIALQVGLLVVMSFGAVLLAQWLSERPGLRLRHDLTADRSNTLHPATLGVLGRLPDDVTVDLFFRPDEFPFTQTSGEVAFRMRKVLLLASEWSDGRIEVQEHDPRDLATGGGTWEQRVRELGLAGVRPGGLLVVSSGARKAVMHTRGDLADVDPGNPYPQDFVPARVVAFRGEEALTSALLKVSEGEAPKICFSIGHGERDIYGDDDFDLGRLHRVLVEDGFRVERWRGEEDGAVPEDCTVLALIGPQTPFSEAEAGWIRDFVDHGGRIVAAPGRADVEAPLRLEELCAGWGIDVRTGFLARPLVDPTSGEEVEGLPQCTELYLTSSEMRPPHPITDPLRRGGRRIRFAYTRALTRGVRPAGGQLVPILSTGDEVWRDIAIGPNEYAFTRDDDEEHGPFTVGLASMFPPRAAPVGAVDGVPARRETRVLVIGSELAFASALLPTNRDFLLNVFNWAAAREFRVRISHADPELRRVDLGDARVVRALAGVGLVGLPGIVLLCGLATAWRRRH